MICTSKCHSYRTLTILIKLQIPSYLFICMLYFLVAVYVYRRKHKIQAFIDVLNDTVYWVQNSV